MSREFWLSSRRAIRVPPIRKFWLTESLERLVHLYEALEKPDEAASGARNWRRSRNRRPSPNRLDATDQILMLPRKPTPIDCFGLTPSRFFQ